MSEATAFLISASIASATAITFFVALEGLVGLAYAIPFLTASCCSLVGFRGGHEGDAVRTPCLGRDPVWKDATSGSPWLSLCCSASRVSGWRSAGLGPPRSWPWPPQP
jgi:hypothetical protein